MLIADEFFFFVVSCVQADRRANWASKQQSSLAPLLVSVYHSVRRETKITQIFSWALFFFFSSKWQLVCFLPTSAQLRNSGQNQVVKEMPCHWFVNVLLIGWCSPANEMPEFGGLWCNWAELSSFMTCFSEWCRFQCALRMNVYDYHLTVRQKTTYWYCTCISVGWSLLLSFFGDEYLIEWSSVVCYCMLTWWLGLQMYYLKIKI